MLFVIGHCEDERVLLLLESCQKLERRSDAIGNDENQLGRFEPSGCFAAVADEDDTQPFVAKAFERLVERKRDPLDKNDDWRGACSCGAADLIFDQGPAGEREQCREPPGIVFLIRPDQCAERQPNPPLSPLAPALPKRTPRLFCNGFRARTKMVNCPT